MKNEDYMKKLYKIFTSAKNLQKVDFSIYGINYVQFMELMENNFTFVSIKTREDAWDLYKSYPDLTLFSRVAHINKKETKDYLTSLVLSDEKITDSYVSSGSSHKELVHEVNMPFVDVVYFKNKVKRLNISHTQEQIDTIRSNANRLYINDKEKFFGGIEKRKATNQEKYGCENALSNQEVRERISKTNLNKYGVATPFGNKEIQEKIKQTNLELYGRTYCRNNNIRFTPTKYVQTKEQAIAITSTPEALEKFLKNTFPEQEQFTLHEVSIITGRRYHLISAKFGTNLPFIKPSQQGHLPEQMQNFLEDLGYVPGKDFIINDRQAIKPLEIDFYFPKEKVGIEVNDFATHNSTFNPFGGPTKPKKYHMEKSKLAKEKGIRLLHAWEHYFGNEDQLNVLKNAIKHALGISAHRVYARNTYVKEVSNVSLKEFFNKNNIQGFRGAKTAYALFDKKTDEVLMAYSVGASHFAHNKYDMELIRGASKLDTTIVGGASKLWKYIIDNNPNINSIVYYIDRNIYSGSSISALEGSLSLVSTQEGLWNYFVEEDLIKNRQPSKHKEIKELVSTGKVWEIYNAGTETYVWNR